MAVTIDEILWLFSRNRVFETIYKDCVRSIHILSLTSTILPTSSCSEKSTVETRFPR